MSDVPFTPAERVRRVRNAQVIVEEATDLMPGRLIIMAHNALRWDATVRQVEAERDAARCTIDTILDRIKFLESALSEEIPWRKA